MAERTRSKGAAKSAGAKPADSALAAGNSPRTWLRRWSAPVVVLLAIIPYLNTLTADLVLDDVFIVKENEQIRRLGNIPALFLSHYWAGTSWIADRGLYRPLTMATYAVNYALHGAWPAGFHAANVLLHAATTVLLFVLLRRLFDNWTVAFITAAWFAVHPVHTEAVTGIVGRAEVLAALGVFGCVYGYERARTAASAPRASRSVAGWVAVAIVSYAAACFAKETGVVAPALIVALELIRPERRWIFRGRPAALALLGGCIAVAAGYVALRMSIVEPAPEHPGWRIVSAAGQVGVVSTDVRVWTALRVGLEYVGLVLFPWRLSADYWTTVVPLARAPLAPGTLAAIIALITATVLILKTWRKHPALAFGFLLFAIALFPVSNLPFLIGVMKAERLMYIPSAGLLLAAAVGVAGLLRRPAFSRPVWIGVGIVTAALGVRTIVRNLDWQSNHSMALATLRYCPESPIWNTNLGLWHRANGRLDEAYQYVARSATAEPLNGDTRSLMGHIALSSGRVADAIANFELANRLRPNFAPILAGLAEAYFAAQRWADAAAVLERVKSLWPDEPASYLSLAGAYLNMGDGGNALRVAEEGLAHFPTRAELHGIAAQAYDLLGRPNDAARERAAALAIDTQIEQRQPPPP